MIKISVFEDQNKVIARLDGCKDDAYNYIKKRLPKCVILKQEAVQMPNSFRAIVRCNPDDIFDGEIGAEIARKRVIAKYDRAMRRVLAPIVKDLGLSVSKISVNRSLNG